MRRISRSALVPYLSREMFDLVDDIDRYAEFLPWCNHSEVLKRDGDQVEATLELHKGSISKSFTTRNTNRDAAMIEISLLGGPFRQLAGGWRFQPLGQDGCKVTLQLEFEFESKMLDMLFGAFFEETCNSLVDAFTRRAAEIYGPR